MSDSQSKDALTPAVITDIGASRPVPEDVARVVEEGKRAGIAPESEPTPSTAMHPRSHLPKYKGKMRGQLPDNHPTVLRQQAEYKAMRRREAERDAQIRAIESTVPQKLKVGTKVVIGDNAKVDYEDENGVRVKGHYGGIEGEIFQTYVDKEGNRRHIIVDRDPVSGKSKYAPVAVREGDLKELNSRREGGGRRFHAVPKSPAQRAQEAEAARRRFDGQTQEEIERATFGGRTAEELANLMCGL